VRFLLRSGKEYDQTPPDSDRLSPRFLGYFLFRSSYKKPSLDKRLIYSPCSRLHFSDPCNSFQKLIINQVPFLWSSTSFKEQSAHVASVKNILESHASYLMSGKELSKLVAFVKGTQFDLVVSKTDSFLEG